MPTYRPVNGFNDYSVVLLRTRTEVMEWFMGNRTFLCLDTAPSMWVCRTSLMASAVKSITVVFGEDNEEYTIFI